MPTPTTRLRARLIDSGTELNTWGGNLNDQVFSLFDEAIAGVEKVSLTGSNGAMTLASSNYASDQARNAALIFQGTPAVNVSVTIPAVEKVYVVSNTTAKDVTLSAGGAGVTLAAGDRAVVWCDGTECGFGSISSTTVNGLIANAQLAGANLPGQTGNAGRFLKTDGAVPLWADVPNPDVGGGADATITASVTLSASASVVQSVDMATAAQSVKLPDATLLRKGGRKFVVLGVGNRTFGVRDAAGTLLTVVPAGGAAELHLRDNATAAGSWGVTGRGLEPALTLVDHTAPSTVTAAAEVAVRLTDNLSLHFGTPPGVNLYAVAVDSSPGAAAVGAWTFVDGSTSLTLAHGFRISDTQAIVFWTTGQPAHKAAVLTVNPTTLAITVGTAASTASPFFQNVTFTGRPSLVQLSPTLYLASYADATNLVAISVSGATVTYGAPVAGPWTAPVQQLLGLYRISDTSAFVICIDNSGTAGAPYSIRAAVLSVSGTTISVGTSAGINDVVSTAGAFPTCMLTAGKFLVCWNTSSSTISGAAVTVTGTAVAFGAPVTLTSETGMPLLEYTSLNANRFQPNLYRLSDTTALFTAGNAAGTTSRHIVLSESGGVVTVGTPLYSLWGGTAGGNFPQTPAGFLAFSSNADEQAVFSVTINGTALDVSGTFADAGVVLNAPAGARFGLSGGVFGALAVNGSAGSGFQRVSVYHLFRFRANAPPQYLGLLRRNNIGGIGTSLPVEVAPNKVAMINGSGLTQPAATGDNVRLQIVEFAAS